jgi:hypothetical protein
VRRVTLVAGWDHLPEVRREAFRLLAKDAVAGANRIRAASQQTPAEAAKSQIIA